MGSAVEEAGQFATATAAARVLDGPQAAGSGGEGAACLNCGARLSGAYCATCGQRAHLHRSLPGAAEEFLHGILHFDSKFWATLPLLLVRPGKLTRDYVHGKRARYISPIALFLMTVLLMFLVFGFAGTPDVPDGAIEVGGEAAVTATAELEGRLAELDAEIAAARADPARAAELPRLEMARNTVLAVQTRARSAADDGGYRSSGGSLADLIRENAEKGNITVMLGNEKLNAKGLEALQNPELLFYKMKQKGYKLSFLLVPMSLPWLMLLFLWKKDVRAYDHVVFLLYSISFMSILFMIVAALASWNAALLGGSLVGTLLSVVPLAHIYAQLKEGYALGWFSAAWRTAVLGLFAIITLTLYVTLILLLGVID